MLVVTSTMLAVRIGEKTCSPSTVTLNPNPTTVARSISTRTLPERDVKTHATPSPANNTVLRNPSMASRQPGDGVNARRSRWAAALRSGEKWSCITVASRTIAT